MHYCQLLQETRVVIYHPNFAEINLGCSQVCTSVLPWMEVVCPCPFNWLNLQMQTVYDARIVWRPSTLWKLIRTVNLQFQAWNCTQKKHVTQSNHSHQARMSSLLNYHIIMSFYFTVSYHCQAAHPSCHLSLLICCSSSLALLLKDHANLSNVCSSHLSFVHTVHTHQGSLKPSPTLSSTVTV